MSCTSSNPLKNSFITNLKPWLCYILECKMIMLCNNVMFSCREIEINGSRQQKVTRCVETAVTSRASAHRVVVGSRRRLEIVRRSQQQFAVAGAPAERLRAGDEQVAGAAAVKDEAVDDSAVCGAVATRRLGRGHGVGHHSTHRQQL